MRLLLLPGLDGTELLFAPLLAALPPWLRAEVLTYPTSGPQTYAALLPLVSAALEREPRCILLGWSFAGPLALRAAVLHPERIAGVVLAASFVRPPLRWLRWVRWLIRTPTLATLRAVRRVPIWLLRRRADPLRCAKAQLLRRVSARALAARARAIEDMDARADLRQCMPPVCYLAAAQDTVVRGHCLREVLRERPTTSVATIDGRHLALFTHPVAAAAAIAAFARRVRAQARTADA